MRIRLLGFLLCFAICFGCKNEETPLFDDTTIQKLADIDMHNNIPPPPLPNFYVKSENGSICITNLELLHFQYKAEYTNEYQSFKSFLTDILNLKKKLKRVAIYSSKESCFIPDAEITKKYSNLSFNQFFNEYCMKENENYTFKSHIRENDNHINTVSYFLYLNFYQVRLDEYSGYYYIFLKKTV